MLCIGALLPVHRNAQKAPTMEKQVFIDKFIIPESSAEEFVQRMNYNRSFIKNLPGFLEDDAYERTDESGNRIVITVAKWESEEALNKAQEAVQAEYKRIGFNPPEFLSRLHITMERAVYRERGN